MLGDWLLWFAVGGCVLVFVWGCVWVFLWEFMWVFLGDLRVSKKESDQPKYEFDSREYEFDSLKYAFHHGRAAYRAGRSMAANPYRGKASMIDEDRSWVEGWTGAKMERMK